AQPAPRRYEGAGKTGLGVIEIGQQLYDALVVHGAIGGDVDLARSAVEQPDSQPGLQLLHQLRNAGPTHLQRLGRLGEAARLDYPGERLHRAETIHLCSRCNLIVRIVQTVLAEFAPISGSLESIK